MNDVNPTRVREDVVGVLIDVVSWGNILGRIGNWAQKNETRYICICNVHSVVTALQDAEFGRVVENADMTTPDGAPVAWMLRRMGHVGQERINGPDLMWRYCKQAQMQNVSIFLYGGTEETLSHLKTRLLRYFPELKIAGVISPPFRSLTPEEDAVIVDQINGSGAGVVWVSLGCPKQERWMAAHKGRINAVMIGVGAAFDYHAGTIKRAPTWMQNAGLEWLHRLMSEPRRLWRRYLVTNAWFILLAIKQMLLGKG